MIVKGNTEGVRSRYIRIPVEGRRMRVLILEPKEQRTDRVGVLWLHGGGYQVGMPEMAYFTRAIDLVNRCGAVIVAPGYTLSIFKPYPAGLLDCHAALVYMRDHAAELGIRADKLMVGGESAGGGLTAALCMYAHDNHTVDIAFQMPICPMVDCYDTESSKDNHARVWNTRKNHGAWRRYLRGVKGEVPDYASPSRRKDFSGLPPCYTFVGDLEPFHDETIAYVKALNDAGVEARVDIYPNWYHAYDIYHPKEAVSRKAIDTFLEHFKAACESEN